MRSIRECVRSLFKQQLLLKKVRSIYKMPGRRSSGQSAYDLAMHQQNAAEELKRVIRSDNKKRKELLKKKLAEAAAEKKGGRTRSKRSSKRGTRRR